MPEWSAEVVVDAELARSLIAGQFPAVELASLRLLGEGWDNTVWLAGERWAFRFPRREIAVPSVERQIGLLPLLAPLLPLPIPRPELVGRPTESFGWPFFGTPYLPGREVAEAALDDDARVRLGRPLAEFLRALHGERCLAAVGVGSLPLDPWGRADGPMRARRTADRLAELEALGLWRAPASVARLLAQAERLPPPERLAVVHGDLHLRHLLVHADGRAAAVIDWDDLCLADPAIDLVLLWCLLPPRGRGAFLDAYGAVDEAQLLRARLLAIFLCGTLAVFARHEGHASLERGAIDGLDRAAG